MDSFEDISDPNIFLGNDYISRIASDNSFQAQQVIDQNIKIQSDYFGVEEGIEEDKSESDESPTNTSKHPGDETKMRKLFKSGTSDEFEYLEPENRNTNCQNLVKNAVVDSKLDFMIKLFSFGQDLKKNVFEIIDEVSNGKDPNLAKAKITQIINETVTSINNELSIESTKEPSDPKSYENGDFINGAVGAVKTDKLSKSTITKKVPLDLTVQNCSKEEPVSKSAENPSTTVDKKNCNLN